MNNSTAMKNNNVGLFNPQQFALWLGIASIIMMFGAFTSAYMVRQSAGKRFTIPLSFWSGAGHNIRCMFCGITIHGMGGALRSRHRVDR